MTIRATFLRHSQTTKAAPGSGYVGDQARTLTENGIGMAEVRRTALGEPTYDIVGASPAYRAVHTAALIAGIPVEQVIRVPEMGVQDPESGDAAREIDEMFNRLGYKPLSDYHAIDENDRLQEHGCDAINAIMDIMTAAASKNGGDAHGLFVGHAVMVPAMVWMGGIGEIEEVASAANLGECEGFTVVIEEDEITEIVPIEAA